VPCDGGHLAEAGGEMRAIFLFLAQFVLVELPDTAVLLEDRAGVLTSRFRLTIFSLASVRRRAHIDVERSLTIESEALIAMLRDAGQTGHDGFGFRRGLELTGRHFVALHGVEAGYIQVSIA
jgi:hypothetical protein